MAKYKRLNEYDRMVIQWEVENGSSITKITKRIKVNKSNFKGIKKI